MIRVVGHCTHNHVNFVVHADQDQRRRGNTKSSTCEPPVSTSQVTSTTSAWLYVVSRPSSFAVKLEKRTSAACLVWTDECIMVCASAYEQEVCVSPLLHLQASGWIGSWSTFCYGLRYRCSDMQGPATSTARYPRGMNEYPAASPSL